MDKKTKKVIAVAAALTGIVALAASVAYATTESLMQIAFDRKEPKHIEKSRKKLAGSDHLREVFERQAEAARLLQEEKLEEVEIISSDGIRLIGHLYRSDSPKRVILAMHGWRSSWDKDFGIIFPFLRQNDCDILFVEQRAQGQSGGEYIGFGLSERFDCIDWLSWLNQNGFDALPIYLCGISMGASTVLMATGGELPENVKGVLADCGFTSPHAIWKHVLEKNLRLPYTGVMASITNDMCKKKINLNPNDYSCTEALKACKVPVLFVHGTDDSFVPVSMTYENYKACAAPKRLFVVPGAEHGMSYILEQELYEQQLRNFWRDYD